MRFFSAEGTSLSRPLGLSIAVRLDAGLYKAEVGNCAMTVCELGQCCQYLLWLGLTFKPDCQPRIIQTVRPDAVTASLELMRFSHFGAFVR